VQDSPARSVQFTPATYIKQEVVDIYEMSDVLVAQLRPYSAAILDAKNKFNLKSVLEVVLRITVDDSMPTPAIGFNPEVIAFLSSVGASIDIDTYRNP